MIQFQDRNTTNAHSFAESYSKEMAMELSIIVSDPYMISNSNGNELLCGSLLNICDVHNHSLCDSHFNDVTLLLTSGHFPDLRQVCLFVLIQGAYL